MITMLDPYATTQAAKLGHDIRWETVGDNLRNGYCLRCGMTLSVAQPGVGLHEAHGQALVQLCPQPSGAPGST